MTDVLVSWWSQLDTEARGRRHGLLLCIALFLFAYLLYSWWYIEDAAISFAFARHLAQGDGLVAYPGGERVEGFSNPTWTLLLAVIDALGVNPFISAKLLGAGLGVLTLWATLRWAERLMGPDAGAWPVLAPALLAISPQLVLWNASGLENALFNALLPLGAIRLLYELEAPGRPAAPWSALAFALLALTRPEAPLYAAVAGLIAGLVALRRLGWRGALRWSLRWGLALLLPMLLWHGWRYAYFAWELPNTYYAKLWNADRFQPLELDRRGWAYLRRYALASAQGFLLPVYALGQTGMRGWRGLVGGAMVLLCGLVFLPLLEWPEILPFYTRPELGETYMHLAIGLLVGSALLLPQVGLGRRGARPRQLAWWMGLTALFFAIYSGGDWMKGFRWLSFCVVPMALLLADGVRELVRSLPRPRLARGLAGVVVATAAIASVVHLGLRLGYPETSPYDVKRRVMYMQGVQQRLHLDDVALLEVDMGAHMWWSGFEVVDMAGLVDVPMARSGYDKPYIRSYAYEERNPEFAHVHGSWANTTRLRAHRAWRDYLEIAPYPVSPWQSHVGSHVRKDLFIAPRWEGPGGRRVPFGEAVVMQGWDLPAPYVAPGGGLYVELGWKAGAEPEGFRSLLALRGQGRVLVHELPPAYDWYPVEDWLRSEVVLGRHTLRLPEDLPTGRYDLAIVLLGEGPEAGVLPARAAPRGAVLDDPVLARGEVRWSEVLEVAPRRDVLRRADEGVDQVMAAAELGQCTRALDRWAVARRYLPPEDRWQEVARARAEPALAGCLVRQAAHSPDRERAVARLKQARRLDHDHPELLEIGAELADAWQAEGDAARAAGDLEEALAALSAAMAGDPTRSWVRRAAEEVRRELSDAEEADKKRAQEERRRKKELRQRKRKQEAEADAP